MGAATSSDGTFVWDICGNNTLNQYDANNGQFIKTVALASENFLTTVSSDGSNVWATENNGYIIKYNIATDTSLSIFTEKFNTCVSSDGKFVWVTDLSGLLYQYNTYNTDMSQNQPISTDLEYVSSDGTNVWAANNNIVYKINVASFSFDFSFNTGYSINSISSDGINVWTSSGNYNNVSRFNIATGTTDSINLNLVTSVINSDGTYVWVGCGPSETFEYSSIVKLNAQTGQPVGSPIFINGNTIQPTGISSDGTFVWVGFDTSSVFQYQIFPDAPTADGNSVTYKKGKKGTVSLYTPKIQVIPGTPTMPSPPHSYQLLKNGRVVSTTYSFDFATHIFTFKDVDMLEPGTYEFVWYDATAKKTLYRFTIHNGNPICFGKGTDILCIHPDTGKPVYKKIETLKEGDLVKTYKRGIKRITEIIEGEFINNPNVWHNCMYKMSKRPGMTNDLWVTGGHSILIDKLKIPTNIVKKQLKILGSNIIVEDKCMWLASECPLFQQVKDNETYTYYHLALEHDNQPLRKYGIWANGVLTETASENQIKRNPLLPKGNKERSMNLRFH